MALNSGKILMRRGQEANFDPNKMMPGEWAVSLDSKFVRMCFSPGVCIRMATYEAFEADMEQIRQILAECQTVEEAVQRIYEDIKDVAVDVERIETAAASALKSEENALNSANSAVQSANTATQKASEAAGSANIASTKAEQATEGANTATQKASDAAESADNVRNMSELSQSYAVGGTGTREGEDTDNAKYYNQQASGNADRAEEAAERASAAAGFGGTYTELRDKPRINDVELDGNKTIDELGIASKEALEETDNKVNIIIENAELRFKETASGENIHLDDSADSKLVEFAMYGKARQNTTSGKNLLENTATSQTINGVTFAVNGDGTVTLNGTATANCRLILSEKNINLDNTVASCVGIAGLKRIFFAITNSETTFNVYDSVREAELSGNMVSARLYIDSGGTFNNAVVKPMIRLASDADDTYEPYTGGIPSPNPDYPQDIEVSGESYNLLENTATSQTVNGVTFTVNEDKSITANGTATAQITFDLIPRESTMLTEYIGEELILSGCPSGGGQDIYQLQVFTSNFSTGATDRGSGLKFTLTDSIAYAYITIFSGVTVENLTFYPMIRKASIKNDRYMPYGKGSVEVKSVGKNLLKIDDRTLTKNGITFEVSQGSVYTKGTATDNMNIWFNVNLDKLTIGETYKVYDLTRVKITHLDGTTLYVTQFTYDDTISIIEAYIQVSIGTTVDKTYYPMICLANITDDTYQPYKETLSTIPTPNGLPGIPVDSGGNYTDNNGQQWICDEIVKYADGSGERVQRVGKVDLGSLTWVDQITSDKRAYAVIEDFKKNNVLLTGGALCEIFFASTSNTPCSFYHYDKTFYFYAPSNVKNISEFKSCVNGKKLIYELADPITTPLTSEQIAEIEKLSTFYPVTNISNDGGCGMKVKYIVDSKNYIDNQLAIQAKLQKEALLNMLLLMPEEVQASMIENDTNKLLSESEV